MNEKLEAYLSAIKDKKVLIQGLGINGGGLGASLFFLNNGFYITITDLKTEAELASSIEKLSPFCDKIKYTLGQHSEKDFIEADIVVKGPGVPPSNKYVKIAEENGAYVTSDIEIFLNIIPCSVYAVTGSKGKSTAVSAIYHIFKQKSENAFLGGNITISPLSFYEELNEDSLVILELSSWQLRDLRGRKFSFRGSAITNLLNDHQNYYSSMQDYLSDKAVIAENQTASDFCILPYNDKFLNRDTISTDASLYFFAKGDAEASFYFDNNNAWFNDNGNKQKLFSLNDVLIPGEHVRLNLLIAAGFCKLAGIEGKYISEGIKSFKGAPFRMEFVREWNGITFYNDTTATIPDAAASALKSFNQPVIWIAGGNDKNLDFKIIEKVAHIPRKIFLLSGHGTDKMKQFIKRDDIEEYDYLGVVFRAVLKEAKSGDVVLFSPGCTSFGLFQNEFHRGNVFNQFVRGL